MTSIPRPDLKDRSLTMTSARTIPAKPAVLFEAWTTRLDIWFAQAGTLVLQPHAGQPYFFYNRDEWGRHPHYGRILDIKPGEFVEMTWVTGNGERVGTEGAETVLRVELISDGAVTEVRLTHSGFASEGSLAAHEENWPLALEILDQSIRQTKSD